MSRELFDVVVQKLRETDKAVCVTDDGKREVWLPLSQIEIERKPGTTDLYEVTLPTWLAKDKGLI